MHVMVMPHQLSHLTATTGGNSVCVRVYVPGLSLVCRTLTALRFRSPLGVVCRQERVIMDLRLLLLRTKELLAVVRNGGACVNALSHTMRPDSSPVVLRCVRLSVIPGRTQLRWGCGRGWGC